MKNLFPPLARWFESRFSDFTGIQKSALQHTLAGRNTLILAPTGSGKTFAAFLSVLSELGEEAARGTLPNAVRAVYVSPLRALDRDIHRNLEPPLSALNLPIRMEVRTGDTAMSARGKQQRKRPHLLLTTPESLSSLLSQRGWQDGFAPRVVIVDEIHAFAENKRGSLLALLLERLEERAERPLQRIGLSATAWPVEAVARFLCGERPCEIAAADIRRAHKLSIAPLDPERRLPPASFNPYRAAYPAAGLIQQAKCTLAFTSTRSAAERLGLALTILLPQWEEKIAVHHASIDRGARLKIEDALSEGRLKAVVCSTSLELGVDFAAVDRVLLIGTPRGVSRALQRLGRSGHRINGVAEGFVVPLSLPDLLESVALTQAAREGRLDVLRIPRNPLDVLAQVLLGMSVERACHPDEAYMLLRRSGPYLELSRADFDATLEYLAGGGKVLEAYGKIVFDEQGRFRVASAKTARDYYMNIGTISDDYQLIVRTRANRRLGEVEEGFIVSLQPGEAFIMGGRPVVVKFLYQDSAIVEPARGEAVKTPRWMGGKLNLSAQLAAEEVRLRKAIRNTRNVRSELIRNWGVAPETADAIASYIETQTAAAPVPVDSPVQLERIHRRRTVLLLFHVTAGRAVNRSLAWVAGLRICGSSSVVANFDDRGFVLSFGSKSMLSEDDLRAGFRPDGWREDLVHALQTTEMLGKRFRGIAEVGQLLPKRTLHGRMPRRSATWNSSLLYTTLLKYEPDHPLVREAQRQVLEDELDVDRGAAEAARIFETPWEIVDLPRPSPFAIPLFSQFNRETLRAQDPDRALEELVESMYAEWEGTGEPVR